MKINSTYERLLSATDRPNPFSTDTVARLWADEYISAQMLTCHLDGITEATSFRTDTIEQGVGWMRSRYAL